MKDNLKFIAKKIYHLAKAIKFTVTFKTPFIDFSLAPSILPTFRFGGFFIILSER